jgi:hypothetical protein
MPRADEFSNQVTNPVKKYLKWDSEKKAFGYWSKDLSKTIHIPIPTKLVFLKQLACIRGFHEPSNSGIYSNEVSFFDLKKAELDVRTFGKKQIAKGTYDKIKGDVIASGGKFSSSIYAYMDGELVCLQLVGSSYSAWYDFSNTESSKMSHSYLVVEGSVDKKKGKTLYSEPIFVIGDAISKEDSAKADNAYDEFVAYLDAKGNAPKEQESARIESVEAEEIPAPAFNNAPVTDDLPW